MQPQNIALEQERARNNALELSIVLLESVGDDGWLLVAESLLLELRDSILDSGSILSEALATAEAA